MAKATVFELPEEMIAELRKSITVGPIVKINENGAHTYYFNDAVVERFQGLKVHIYANEHPPPHFHVTQSDGSATFALDDGRMIQSSGNTRKFEKNIRVYYLNNRTRLIEFWNATRPAGCPVGPVEV